jgi:hypothetical protein
MPVLEWRNDSDGFAFANSWTFDRTEKRVLSGIAAAASPTALGALAAFIPDPLLLTGAAVALQAYIAVDPLPGYGLCGGMAFSALDHWNARVPIPRGANVGDQPSRAPRGSTGLREVIWSRLIDSLTVGTVMPRTIEWTFLLNLVPAHLGGGAGEILRRTKAELAILRAHIDAGRPWPIGLIYDQVPIWEQHQVLVFGYEDVGPNRVNLLVYDNNAPAQSGQTVPSLITLSMSGSGLTATTPNDVQATPDNPLPPRLAGFFCSNYVPAAPTTLARSFGEFVTATNAVGFFQMTGGARIRLANTTELTALGGSVATLLSAGDFVDPKHSTSPRDGIMFRERSSASTFIFRGGAPFRLASRLWIDRFGGTGAIRIVADGSIRAFPVLPAEGTLLREWSDPKVYRIMSGVRRWVTTPAELGKYGGSVSVRLVPDGALSSIVEGAILPPPGANECATQRTKIASLNTEIVRLDEALSNASSQRDVARIRARLLTANRELGIAKSRVTLLQCP